MEQQNLPLAGQTAIVSGGSTGIGRACCVALARAGARVGINYHSKPDAADTLLEEIRAAGSDGVALAGDVSREEDVVAMFDALVAAFGRVDIVIANAGLQMDHAFGEMPLADWQRVLDVNLTGQFLFAREGVRRFRRQPPPSFSKARGKILCMSSVHEVIPWAGHVNYAASKGGVMLMMKSLAQEVAAERIRVNGIAPGAIRTAINASAWQDEASREKLVKLIPYGRIGEPEDVAKVATWLASDESDYVTGTTIVVDGGMLLYPGFRDNG